LGNTQDEIRDRLLAAIPETFDKTEGSFFYDSIMPAAIELALAYAQVETNLLLGFAQTTSGQYLGRRAGEHGVTRKVAVKATGQVTISGANGTVVPAGSIFSTGGGIQFQTTEEVIIDISGDVNADVEALSAGTNGNTPAGAINSIPVTIAMVTGVTNAQSTTGGVDTESDSELLNRLLDKVRQPATSGNTHHYRQWAMEVGGIGDARIESLWTGNGTVRVILLDSDKQPASSAKITEVADYIETVRPIGATVTVISATGLDIDVAADVTLSEGYTLEGVTTDVETAIFAYLAEIAFQQNYVSYAKLGSILLDTPGIIDYSGLTVNMGTANVEVGDTEVAILGTVTLT